MSAVRRRDRTISDSAAYNKRKMIAVRGGAQVGPVAVSDSLLAKQTARSDFRENETGQPTVESRPRAYSARQVDVTGELRGDQIDALPSSVIHAFWEGLYCY